MLHSVIRGLRPALATTSRPGSPILTRRYSDLNSAFPPPFSPRSSSRKLQTRTARKNKGPAQPVVNLIPENRCAQVRSWEMLRNTTEALTLIRAVEQKYGPIESFEFRKDVDSPTIYQTVVLITFRSLESFNRLPSNFEILHVRPPKVDLRRPGGIGLDEISSLFTKDVEFLTADQVSETALEERTVNFRIERASQPFIRESPYKFFGSSMAYRKAVASMMLKWGGFHELQRIESTHRITNADLTDGTIDHVFMRRTLRQWAAFLNERNPYENYPADSEESLRDIKDNAQDDVPMTQKERRAWFSDTVATRATLDPFQQVLEMEGSQAAATFASGPRPMVDSQPKKPSTSLRDTTFNEVSRCVPREGLSATKVASGSLRENQPSASPNLPPHTRPSALSNPSPHNPTTFLPPDAAPEKPNLSPIELSLLTPEEARVQGKTPIEFLVHEQKSLGPNPRKHRRKHTVLPRKEGRGEEFKV